MADSFDHRASSGLRYIVNPPGSTARVHQHLDIGQGDVDWDEFFGTLDRLGFGRRDETIMTVCVFAWEDRARESSLANREEIERRMICVHPVSTAQSRESPTSVYAGQGPGIVDGHSATPGHSGEAK